MLVKRHGDLALVLDHALGWRLERRSGREAFSN